MYASVVSPYKVEVLVDSSVQRLEVAKRICNAIQRSGFDHPNTNLDDVTDPEGKASQGLSSEPLLAAAMGFILRFASRACGQCVQKWKTPPP